jgi:hypothetical protein
VPIVGELDEYAVALRVAAVLEELGIDYTLGGSLASSLHGEPRATNDVDFAVRLEERHVAPLVERLGPDFAIDPDALRNLVCRNVGLIGITAVAAGPWLPLARPTTPTLFEVSLAVVCMSWIVAKREHAQAAANVA